MKLRIILVGKDRNDPLVQAADEYLDRLRHHQAITVLAIKEEPARTSNPVDVVKKREADRIREHLVPGELLIALDENGKAQTSLAFANRMKGLLREGKNAVTFLIGGPNGLDRELLVFAQERWSLSPLTLPHRLARLVLAEQLYRAFSILRGEPYHK